MMTQLIADMRSWVISHHVNSAALLWGVLAIIIVVAVLLKFLKPPKV